MENSKMEKNKEFQMLFGVSHKLAGSHTGNIIVEDKYKQQSRNLNEMAGHMENNSLNELLEAIQRYSEFDFTQKIAVRGQGDEWDAIAIGVNKLTETIESQIGQIEDMTKQLQTITTELEVFSYSVSHDLRTPLRAINGYAKILLEDSADKLNIDAVNPVHVIIRSTKKMNEFIDDLLAFSRLGRKHIVTSDINMAALVNSVKADMLFGDIEQKIEFMCNELLPTKGDFGLIKQVWMNLISNAIKYSQHKSKIDIEIGSYDKDNHVVYYVKDKGVGFDMQYYDKLFGVFQRLHSDEEFEGAGIGLAIVQKIIHRHHGAVWAESKLHEGASFYFSLPNINA